MLSKLNEASVNNVLSITAKKSRDPNYLDVRACSHYSTRYESTPDNYIRLFAIPRVPALLAAWTLVVARDALAAMHKTQTKYCNQGANVKTATNVNIWNIANMHDRCTRNIALCLRTPLGKESYRRCPSAQIGRGWGYFSSCPSTHLCFLDIEPHICALCAASRRTDKAVEKRWVF